jgi:hypothetical protein
MNETCYDSIGLLYVPSIMQRSLIDYNSLHNTLFVYVQDITNRLKCIMLIKILILKYYILPEDGRIRPQHVVVVLIF